jgi:SulP family sulfate permease
VTNIKSGGRTPVAGILHAVCLVLFLLVLAPLLVEVPLAALAGLLLTVAWNMSEIDKVVHLLRGPRSDVLVLVATYGLTVFTDLTIAVGAGVVFASLLFMKRMADVADITSIRRELSDPDDAEPLSKVVDPADVPPGVELFQISGPFFFGVADKLVHVLRSVESPPKVFILRMRLVPAIDATGLNALEDFVHTCGRMGTTLLLSGVQPDVQRAMAKLGLAARIGPDNFLPGIDAALARARELVTADGAPPVHRT